MLVNRLELLFDPILEGMGYELVLAELKGGGRDHLLRVYIDGPNGIGLGDCEAVSRELSAALDVSDLLPEAYTLEVSSPGLDRPLVKAAHFERFAGQQVKLQMRMPIADGRRRFRGTIVSVEGEAVCIEVEGSEVSLPLADIEKARLVPDFGK